MIPEESKDKLVTESKLDKIAPQVDNPPARGSSQGSSSPVKILKNESTFAKSFGQRNTSNKNKKLTFADENGNNLVQVITHFFVFILLALMIVLL